MGNPHPSTQLVTASFAITQTSFLPFISTRRISHIIAVDETYASTPYVVRHPRDRATRCARAVDVFNQPARAGREDAPWFGGAAENRMISPLFRARRAAWHL